MASSLVQAFSGQFEDADLDNTATEATTVGATAFIMLHEVGHALVHNLGIPITGKEEDAVDDLATLISLEFYAEGQEAVISIIASFASLAEADFETGQIAFHGEHSLSAQRMYSMMCTLCGSNPQQFADIVTEGLLPESRAVRCPSEYQQKNFAWTKLLGRHLKG